jgi:CDGSH-type Zn-finger protein
MPLWDKTPLVINVKKGETKIFCACNGTKTPPFCDGTHRTTSDKTPYVETYDADKTVQACRCGLSKKRPYCDGTHKTL